MLLILYMLFNGKAFLVDLFLPDVVSLLLFFYLSTLSSPVISLNQALCPGLAEVDIVG